LYVSESGLAESEWELDLIASRPSVGELDESDASGSVSSRSDLAFGPGEFGVVPPGFDGPDSTPAQHPKANRCRKHATQGQPAQRPIEEASCAHGKIRMTGEPGNVVYGESKAGAITVP